MLFRNTVYKICINLNMNFEINYFLFFNLLKITNNSKISKE